MFQDFFVPFIAISLAELGDKTQIAILCMAAKTERHFSLLAGAFLAFMVTDGLAILLGNYITNIVPITYIKIASGLVFIIFGIIALLSRREGECRDDPKNPFLSGFTIISLSEMGDKTQIASGLFATRYDPLLVLAGVLCSLAILSLMAIYIGRVIMGKLNRSTISKIAGITFIIIGVFCLV